MMAALTASMRRGESGAVATPGTWLRSWAQPDPGLEDRRGRRVVFVSHCLLNENTRYAGGAFTEGVIPAVVDHCATERAGMVQMPCPEQAAWGGVLKRWMWVAVLAGRRAPRALRGPAIRLLIAVTRARYGRVAGRVCRQIRDFVSSDYDVFAIVGVYGSPSCGVETRLDASVVLGAMMDGPAADADTFNRDVIRGAARAGPGWFTDALARELARGGVDIPFRAVDLLEEMHGSTVVKVSSRPTGDGHTGPRRNTT